jgi:preprotein translocase subunit SecA
VGRSWPPAKPRAFGPISYCTVSILYCIVLCHRRDQYRAPLNVLNARPERVRSEARSVAQAGLPRTVSR